MGLGYVDSVIVYNDYYNDTAQKQLYFGTRFDNVRVELTQGANTQASGVENASACIVKIPNNGNLPKAYQAPEVWNNLTTEQMKDAFTLSVTENNFFVIIKKKGISVDIDLPTGMIDSDSYPGGFYEWIRDKYGYVYTVWKVDVPELMPRFEIYGQ